MVIKAKGKGEERIQVVSKGGWIAEEGERATVVDELRGDSASESSD